MYVECVRTVVNAWSLDWLCLYVVFIADAWNRPVMPYTLRCPVPPVALATTESMAIYPLPTMSSDLFTASLAQLCPKHAVLGEMLLRTSTDVLKTVKDSTVKSESRSNFALYNMII